MVAIDFTLQGVNIPNNTSASVTIYEDVGNNGGGNSETVANSYSVDYDNKDTVSLSDGTTSYSTADVFDGSTGNEYQVYLSQDNTDVTVTAETTFDLTLDNFSSSGATIKVYDGASWNSHPLKTYDGSWSQASDIQIQ